MREKSFGRVGALAIAVLMVVGACSERGGSRASGPEPWLDPDAAWMQGEGTPIVDDLEIPKGARLVGPVFTQLKGADADLPQQIGYLVVDGEPAQVAKAFEQQWDGRAWSQCSQSYETEDGSRTRHTEYTGKVVDGALDISCGVGLARRGWTDESTYLTGLVSVTFEQDLTDPNTPADGEVSWWPPPQQIPRSLPPAPDGVVAPTRVESVDEYINDLVIVEGSFLAGPPGTGAGPGGFYAVIGVNGDPDTLFDAYVRQITTEKTFTLDRTVDGMRVRQYYSKDAGGVATSITMNEKDGNAWILFTAGNDA